jgi:hypothetical protein
MNHADRQRLSTILDGMESLIELERAYQGDEEKIYADELDAQLAEARAIIDQPGPDLILTFNGAPLADTGRIKAAVQAALADQAPSPKLDAFLTEPIHEYIPREPRGIHRAPGRLKATIGLTLATIALIALTAANEPTPGPSHQPTPTKPAEPASWAAPTGLRPGTAPWTVQHRPGTPGNGLGVTTP